MHAADALRAMHSLHLLTMFLPEFQGIDALAVRDVSHRFTVDEHTLQAIENLHALRQSKSKWDERYAGILDELDQPELLYLAILLHDTGKAVTVQDHIPESVAIAKGCLDRLELPEADQETVLFLIRTTSGHGRDSSPGYLRPAHGGAVRGKCRRPGPPENALPVYLCGHQGGQSGGPHAMEGGRSLAALYRHGKLSEPERGRASARGCER